MLEAVFFLSNVLEFLRETKYKKQKLAKLAAGSVFVKFVLNLLKTTVIIFKASAAAEMKFSLFWDVILRNR